MSPSGSITSHHPLRSCCRKRKEREKKKQPISQSVPGATVGKENPQPPEKTEWCSDLDATRNDKTTCRAEQSQTLSPSKECLYFSTHTDKNQTSAREACW